MSAAQVKHGFGFSVLFVGDIMLDRGVAKHAREIGQDSLFKHVERLFLGTHAVIGNLEGTFTDNASIAAQDRTILRFTFDKVFAKVLAKLKFTVVSLANNHTLDFGRDGYIQTMTTLKEAGISFFGSPLNDVNLSEKVTIHGDEFCFVGYHDLFTHDETSIQEEILRLDPECEYIVVFAHWGEEYMPVENERQRTLAHTFIDAGADLIIGAHPHVVQPLEIYKNKAIFYSLGNFMFDQNFSYATTRGLTVHVEWGEESTRFTLVPVFIDHEEVKIAEPTDRTKVLESVVSDALDPNIRSAIFEKQEFILNTN